MCSQFSLQEISLRMALANIPQNKMEKGLQVKIK